jgi:hypothetical protein
MNVNLSYSDAELDLILGLQPTQSSLESPSRMFLGSENTDLGFGWDEGAHTTNM